jgi:hypothetical protein
VLVTAAPALSACTGDDVSGGVPSAADGPTASAGADSGAQEREFVACMRREGITDMPDPVPGDTSVRSAVKYTLNFGGVGDMPGPSCRTTKAEGPG